MNIYFSSFKEKNIFSFKSKRAAVVFLCFYSIAAITQYQLVIAVGLLHLIYFLFIRYDPLFFHKFSIYTKKNSDFALYELSFFGDLKVFYKWLSSFPKEHIIHLEVFKKQEVFSCNETCNPLVNAVERIHAGSCYNSFIYRLSCCDGVPAIQDWLGRCPGTVNKLQSFTKNRFKNRFFTYLESNDKIKYSLIPIVDVPRNIDDYEGFVYEIAPNVIFIQKWTPVSSEKSFEFWTEKFKDCDSFYLSPFLSSSYRDNCTLAIQNSDSYEDQFGFWFAYLLVPISQNGTTFFGDAVKVCDLLKKKNFKCYIDSFICRNTSFFDPVPCSYGIEYCISLNMLLKLFSLPVHSDGGVVNAHLLKTTSVGLPLIRTFTRHNTLFNLNLHVGDIGHTVVLGPTGSGKSVFLSLCIINFLKYPKSRVIALDKDNALVSFMQALDRNHIDVLSSDLSLEGVPWFFDSYSDQIAFFKIIASGNCSGSFDKFEGPIQSSDYFDSLYDVGITLLNRSTADEVKYIISQYGTFLHSAQFKEIEDFRVNLITLNFLSTLSGKILSICNFLIFQYIQMISLKDSAILFVIDEFWFLLKDDVFLSHFTSWLRTFRKRNVSVIVATQNANDTDSASLENITDVLVSNCVSFVFLPNHAADKNAHMYEKFGLNKRDIQCISQFPAKKWYLFCQKKDKVWINLDVRREHLSYLGA